MTRTDNIATTIITGTFAIGLIGNFLVHLAFYLYDGNVEKFLSPTWMIINAITVVVTAVFMVVVRKDERVRV